MKQGGVFSPILYVNYIDELFTHLKMLNGGHHIGTVFCGAFEYADDVVLLASFSYALNRLLEKCILFSRECSLTLNAKKSK